MTKKNFEPDGLTAESSILFQLFQGGKKKNKNYLELPPKNNKIKQLISKILKLMIVNFWYHQCALIYKNLQFCLAIWVNTCIRWSLSSTVTIFNVLNTEDLEIQV